MFRAAAGFAKTHAGFFVRGMCMGAADLVPGVSGGTVAFVAGIYQRLLAAIGAFSSPQLYADVLRFDIGAAWRRCDGAFLATLAAGILSAVFLLGGLLHSLLATRAHLLLAFFCGLVLVSAAAAARQIRKPQPRHIVCGLFGALAALLAVSFPAAEVEPSLAALFFGGAVAICAMLLPGISGSYILLILGLYAHVLEAVRGLQFLTLFVFAAGCAAGMLSFARLLSRMMKQWHDGMTSFLIGVMLGALPKLWPWKEKAEGAKIILRPNILPGEDGQILLAAALCVGGGVAAAALLAAAKKH